MNHITEFATEIADLRARIKTMPQVATMRRDERAEFLEQVYFTMRDIMMVFMKGEKEVAKGMLDELRWVLT